MSTNTKRLIITTLPLIATVVLLLLKKYIFALSELLPECSFRNVTGFLCPGCGNTRAIKALLSFDFIGALKYNITFPVILVFLVLLYIQHIISAWIRPVRLVSKSVAFYIVLAVTFVLYFIIRNFVH